MASEANITRKQMVCHKYHGNELMLRVHQLKNAFTKIIKKWMENTDKCKLL